VNAHAQLIKLEEPDAEDNLPAEVDLNRPWGAAGLDSPERTCRSQGERTSVCLLGADSVLADLAYRHIRAAPGLKQVELVRQADLQLRALEELQKIKDEQQRLHDATKLAMELIDAAIDASNAEIAELTMSDSTSLRGNGFKRVAPSALITIAGYFWECLCIQV